MKLLTLIGYLPIVIIYLAVVIVPAIPVCVYLASLLMLASLWVLARKRPPLKRVANVASVSILLVTIPGLGLHTLSVGADVRALKAHFGTTIAPHSVAKYRHRLIAFDDHEHHWRLRDVDANDCNQMIHEYDLKIRSEGRFSCMHPPSWWPKSTQGYTIFEGDDRQLGSREIWVPQEGSTVYLFKFSE